MRPFRGSVVSGGGGHEPVSRGRGSAGGPGTGPGAPTTLLSIGSSSSSTTTRGLPWPITDREVSEAASEVSYPSRAPESTPLNGSSSNRCCREGSPCRHLSVVQPADAPPPSRSAVSTVSATVAGRQDIALHGSGRIPRSVLRVGDEVPGELHQLPRAEARTNSQPTKEEV